MQRKIPTFFLFLLISYLAIAQKKSLDHSVYDNWESIGEKKISNDGRWVVYTIDLQEGDNKLIIQSPFTNYKKTITRGYDALITEDSRFVIFKIKAPYKDVRKARMEKKKSEDFPKDSFAILELGKDSAWKAANVTDYKTPRKTFEWVAYHQGRSEPRTKNDRTDPKKITDSLTRIIDSLRSEIALITKQPTPSKKKKPKDEEYTFPDANDDDSTSAAGGEITELILRNMRSGEVKNFGDVTEYYFSDNGSKLLIKKNVLPKSFVLLYDLRKGLTDTLSKNSNGEKNFTITEDGTQVAFLAERDSSSGVKGQEKTYCLWYYKEGMDSAVLLADKNSVGMKLGMTISEFGNLEFSKSGKRLFFGTSPIQAFADTTVPDMDKARLDIWNYKDEDLQTVQLFNLKRDLQKNYLAVYDFESGSIKQLGSPDIPVIYKTGDGDGEIFAGISDVGKRIEFQWTGNTKKDIYAVNVNTGTNKLIKQGLQGVITSAYISPAGKNIMWYDSKVKNYFAWDGKLVKNITVKIKAPLWNEDHDSPSDPPPYGIMGWHEGDSVVYIYDRYDIWKVSLNSLNAVNLTNERSSRVQARYDRTDPEKTFFSNNDKIVLRIFDEEYKLSGYTFFQLGKDKKVENSVAGPFDVSGLIKAKDSFSFVYLSGNFQLSPNLKFIHIDSDSINTVSDGFKKARFISSINPQQKDYNWGTAELFKWKAYDGEESEGIIYKPEDFDPKKKYPMICYFYEKLSNGLYNYQAPAPTPSRLNIPFFVSRGYIVFVPDIHYGTGHPGLDAYNYVVSGTRALVKKGFVDSTRLGLQGQSWGGYQVAFIITMTNLYKAAWAGAPVVNMTSAYGGIRWESGRSRQFQYEKTQSRIGATLWEKPELYIQNSPLFHLPKINTPLVIVANDKDGAVPWYQGIEFFTAMRRLGKKIWMLSYNDEGHNLVERRNRKDLSIREQQFFDWLLKGERPPLWITEGIPAVQKGKDWGLDLD